MKIRSIGLFFVLISMGCTTTPRITRNETPEELFKKACSPGQKIQSVQGVIWFKTQSKEISGQFSANIVAQKPSQLKLEVTNFLGGTEALITVNQNHYIISRGHEKGDEQSEGYDSWGGIPLKWATDLFLGKIPCPPDGKEEKLKLGPEGELIVETGSNNDGDSISSQKFIYTFREFQGKSWPESLKWEKVGTSPVAVDFKFDDPDLVSFSPKKWEARSNRGAIKVRWREREVSY